MPLPDIRQAATMIEEGRIEPARTVLRNILHKVPSHLSARVLLARVLESEGDLEGAITMWKQAAFHGPDVKLIEDGLREALLKKRFGMPVPIEPLPADYPVPERESTWDAGRSAASPPTAGRSAASPPTAGRSAASPPTAASGPDGNPPEFQDLDRLITELETAAIVPDPEVPLLSPDELDSDIEDVVSETLARIYANQSYFEEAALVYAKLATQHPDRREEFLQRSAEMKEKAG